MAIVITHILKYCNNLTEMGILLILQDSCKQTNMQHAQKRAHIFTIATTVVACHCRCGWQVYTWICYLRNHNYRSPTIGSWSAIHKWLFNKNCDAKLCQFIKHKFNGSEHCLCHKMNSLRNALARRWDASAMLEIIGGKRVATLPVACSKWLLAELEAIGYASVQQKQKRK